MAITSPEAEKDWKTIANQKDKRKKGPGRGADDWKQKKRPTSNVVATPSEQVAGGSWGRYSHTDPRYLDPYRFEQPSDLSQMERWRYGIREFMQNLTGAWQNIPSYIPNIPSGQAPPMGSTKTYDPIEYLNGPQPGWTRQDYAIYNNLIQARYNNYMNLRQQENLNVVRNAMLYPETRSVVVGSQVIATPSEGGTRTATGQRPAGSVPWVAPEKYGDVAVTPTEARAAGQPIPKTAGSEGRLGQMSDTTYVGEYAMTAGGAGNVTPVKAEELEKESGSSGDYGSWGSKYNPVEVDWDWSNVGTTYSMDEDIANILAELKVNNPAQYYRTLRYDNLWVRATNSMGDPVTLRVRLNSTGGIKSVGEKVKLPPYRDLSPSGGGSFKPWKRPWNRPGGGGGGEDDEGEGFGAAEGRYPDWILRLANWRGLL